MSLICCWLTGFIYSSHLRSVYSNSAKYCIQSDSSECEILCQKSLPCVSTPADFILVFRTLLNRLDCIIVLNCYSNCSGHALAYFFLLTFFPFPCIIRNKKWVCYRTAIAQAGCSFLFLYLPYHTNIDFHLLHA